MMFPPPPPPMREAYSKFAFWTVVAAGALYVDVGPIVFIPATALLAVGWWAVMRFDQ